MRPRRKGSLGTFRTARTPGTGDRVSVVSSAVRELESALSELSGGRRKGAWV